VYDFEKADPEVCRKILDLYEGEATRLLAEYKQDRRAALESDEREMVRPSPIVSEEGISSFALSAQRFPLRKVYDLALKCSHLFNILDARGAISVTERVALIGRVRKLACAVAAICLDRQTALEVPA
jgi:glycyl-tRNA synthetase alpha chain